MKRIATLMILMASLLGMTEAARAEVYWKPIDRPLVVEPAELLTTWGYPSSVLHFGDLEWTRWGSQETTAVGFVQVKTCDPNCNPRNDVTVDGKVWLSEIRKVCGINRYMHIRVAYYYESKWQHENFPDVTCRGKMANIGGHPYPNSVPKPKPRPQPRPKVTFIEEGTNFIRKPRRLFLGARALMHNIRWTSWGSRRAIGVGRFFVAPSIGMPNDEIGPTRARITYFHPIKCGPRFWVLGRSFLRYGERLRGFIRFPNNPSPCKTLD